MSSSLASLRRTFAHKVTFYESRMKEFVERHGLSRLTKSFKADLMAFCAYLQTCKRPTRRPGSALKANANELEVLISDLDARWTCMLPFVTNAPDCIFVRTA